MFDQEGFLNTYCKKKWAKVPVPVSPRFRFIFVKGGGPIKIYSPVVFVFLLVINITWFYYVFTYSNLSNPEVILVNFPLLIGTVAYIVVYFKRKNNNSST